MSRALGVALLAGCTKSPPLPSLPQGPAERVVLDDALDVADFRSLFEAMNRGGRLEPLKSYWRNASDAELRTLADLANRYLYEDAYLRDGLPQLLARRNAERGFSRWRADLLVWAKEATFNDEARALVGALTTTGFESLLKRDASFLDGRWPKWLDRARDDYRELEAHPAIKPPSGATLTTEMRGLSRSTAFHQALATLGEQTYKNDPLLPFFQSLRTARENGANGETGILFEGFGYGLAGLVDKKAETGDRNVFEALLQFVRVADGNPNGLFSAIQERVKKEPASMLPFVNATNELLPRALFGYLKERLSRPRPRGGNFDRAFWLALGRRDLTKPPGRETLDLFIAIRESIERITDLNRPAGVSDFFLFNLPIHLNAYVLTKWGEAFARENGPRWEKLGAQEFDRALWNTPATIAKVEVTLLGEKNGATGLSELHEKEMKGLGGFDEFVDALAESAGKDGYGTFNYTFPAGDEKDTFGSAWVRAVEECHKQRAFADAGSVVRAAVFGLTRPARPGAPTVIDRLEGVNLMDTFNLAVGSIDDKTWNSLRALLFDDFELGRLPPSKRSLVLDFYDGRADLHARAVTLFDTIQAIDDFDRPIGRLPSPLTTFRRWASAFPIRSVHGLTAVFRFAGDSEIVAGKFGPAGFTAKFPGLHGLLREGRPVARTLHAFSWLAEHESEDFRRAFLHAMGSGGWREHLDYFDRWTEKTPIGVARLFERAQRAESRLLPGEATLSSEARGWIQRFVSRGDHALLWNYLRRHASAGSLLEVVAQLKKLSKNGNLSEAFRMLEAIRNERIQFLARTFREWDRTGELVAFLDVLEIAITPTHASNPSP